MHANFNATPQTLIRSVLADHPDWDGAIPDLAWFRNKEHVVDNSRRYGTIHRW